MSKKKWCEKCGAEYVKSYYGSDYCKGCYVIQMFGTDKITSFLDKNNIRFMYAADRHIVLTKRHRAVIEFCNELELDYWFGQGEKHENYMHVENKEAS